MKLSIPSVFAVACAALIFLPEPAKAAIIYHNDFSNEVYVSGESIVGVDGWVKGTITSGSNNDARIETPGWANGKALYLHSSITPYGNPGTVTVRKDLAAATTERFVQFDAVMAFSTTFTGDSGVNSRMFLNNPDPTSASGVSPFIFGLNLGSGSGIYFTGQDGTVVILDKKKVVKDSPYTFSVQLDFELKVFNLTVTGMQKNDIGEDIAFSWSSDAPILFRMGNNGRYSDSISSFSMTQNSTVLSGYLDEVTIQSIPEPSTAAALVGGSVLILSMRFRNRFGR